MAPGPPAIFLEQPLLQKEQEGESTAL